MVMPYHLHMPSYFLETFTEYPNAVVSFVGARFARPKTVCFVSSGRQTLPLQLTMG